MKTPLLGIAAVLLLCAGCDNDPVVTEPGAKETADRKESTDEPSEALAEPSEIPSGLGGLNLTKDQAAKINQWLEQQGELVDPSKFTKYVENMLREDQKAEFRKIIETGGR
ncbi:MAG: hypothetical protein KJO79_08330 [Verrucomicrobiae bacterium]|nr:hypothetical protein [Verrucomicrobiae bacterium]NNJ87173.1 hypothetical protein [Akkermansiaceae bacterium]